MDLTRGDVQRLVARFFRPRGFLFLGHAEGVTPPPERFEAVACPGGFVYRRA